MTIDIDNITEKLDEYVTVLDEMAETNFNVVVIFITDIIKNGSYVIYDTKSQDLIEDAFGLKNTHEGALKEKSILYFK